MSEAGWGPHEPNMRGNWWQRNGWRDEDEYLESITAPCGRCKSVEVLDEFHDEKLCFDCWWSARQSEPCFLLKSKGWGYLGGDQPTGYTREEADKRVLDFPPGEYTVVPGDWNGAGRIAHNGYMNRRRGAILAAHPEYAK